MLATKAIRFTLQRLRHCRAERRSTVSGPSMVGSPSFSSTFQEDEIPFSMSIVERRRALETGIARRVSTLVSCCPPLSAGIAVSFPPEIQTPSFKQRRLGSG
jgi:hypothetical protein